MGNNGIFKKETKFRQYLNVAYRLKELVYYVQKVNFYNNQRAFAYLAQIYYKNGQNVEFKGKIYI